MTEQNTTMYDVIVIGAGFCGVACGAGLKTFGIDNFVILEKGDCCGYFWKSCTYDRLHLHTPYHDLPHDQGLVWKYPRYKSASEVVSYINEYSDLHKLSPKIRFKSNVTNINKITDESNKNLWSITYDSNDSNSTTTILSKYLVIATSTFRCSSIPKNLSDTMNNFNGDIMHSINYKNASKWKNKNMLVIGNGNSACEICIDAVEHGCNKITLVSRRARHFIPLTTYEKGIFRQLLAGKLLGFFDSKVHPKLMKLTIKHRAWRGVIDGGKAKSDKMSVDLSKYGIIKPELSNTEETVNGNYEVIDIGFIPLLEKGRVNVINKGGVKGFDGDKIMMENGEILKEKYDVVVLCTGFQHGLEKLFDDKIFNKYFYDGVREKSPLYKRYGIWPKTNGFNQGLNDKTLFFGTFDAPITGGLARGLWGFQIARNISKDEGKYNKNMELSHWNYMNTLVYCGIGVAAVSIFGGIGAASWYFWKNKQYKKIS